MEINKNSLISIAVIVLHGLKMYVSNDNITNIHAFNRCVVEFIILNVIIYAS